jgi:hypothetical protein
MEIKIIELNKPNSKQRIYTSDLIEKSIIDDPIVKEMLDTKSLFIEDCRYSEDSSDSINVSNIIGVVNKLYIRDNFLFADVEALDTDLGKESTEISHIYLNGQGDLDANGVVSNYRFLKFTGE